MMDHKKIFESYKGKKVFVTGHTGFKGSWLTEILLLAGAQVTGYSLEPPTEPSLFKLCGFDASVNERMVFPSGGSLKSIIADIRDLEALSKAMDEEEFEFAVMVNLGKLHFFKGHFGNAAYGLCLRQRASLVCLQQFYYIFFLHTATSFLLLLQL